MSNPTPVLPVINLNGDSASTLLEQYKTAHDAVAVALDALAKCETHGRNFGTHLIGEGSFQKARAEHQIRIERLYETKKELLALTIHCFDADKI